MSRAYNKTPRTADYQRMRHKIISVLDESGMPISTPDLIALVATGMSHPRSRVWVTLRQLLTQGVVTRTVKEHRYDGRTHHVAFWQKARG